jgi:glycosyltransferase involved in cell wall biosynthesis
MRVLLVHSFYQQYGGEDAVVEAELALLRDRGHEVETWFSHNRVMSELSPLKAAARTIWSSGDHEGVADLVQRFRPDVVHVHNTFQSLSPAVISAAARAGAAVVQTLHNFRLICPQAMLLRHGRVCEDCVGHVPWRGVARACYRGSVAQSAALTAMVMVHLGLGTYQRGVDRFIALSQFSRQKLIEGGLPGERIAVKPNFFEWADEPLEAGREGGVFVGRLSAEKGIEVLLQARQSHGLDGVDVIGHGDAFQAEVARSFGPQYLGFRSLDFVVRRLQSASFLVLPSICYENFPRTIVEAFACGVPVVASRMGAMAELVQDGRTGLLFDPGNAQDLAQKVAWAHAHPDEMLTMGREARQVYLARYRADTNHELLMSIYDEAIKHRSLSSGVNHA